MDYDCKKMGAREIQEKKPSSIRNKEIGKRFGGIGDISDLIVPPAQS
jgi:hypothetical protein